MRSPETLDMVERLSEINSDTDPMLSVYRNDGRARHFETVLATETEPSKILAAMRQYAIELLNAGESLRAVEVYEALEQFESKFANLPASDLQLTQIRKATAWIRVGEQENCILNHTSDSCLLPITGNGVHQLKKGSTEAVKILTELLTKQPDLLDAYWLLNVAYMTLGEYPDGVPEQWRISPDRFRSDYDVKKFKDIAGELGIDENELAGGTIIDDFNNDGYPDLMTSGFSLTSQLRLFMNDQSGGFEDRTLEAGLEGLTAGLNMIQADYNNDGFTDVLVLRGGWLASAGRIPNSLLRNNGDGTFSDVSRQAGLRAARPTQTARFFDYNGDGWLDLFIGNESTEGARHRSELYTNNGDGTFRENAFQCGIRVMEFVKGVTSGDYNNDGRPDLYLSIMGGDNILLRNDGPVEAGKGEWAFTDTSTEAGVQRPVDSFSCWFFDYDNDGWLDLMVFNYDLTEMRESIAEILGIGQHHDNTRLYRNRGDGTFEDVSETTGLNRNLLAMGANYGDLDNDGWLDLYVGTGNPDLRALVPNKMYRNNAGGRFQDVTTSGGFGHLQKGHAIAFADLDLDGDQDVYANMGGAFSGDVYRNALFENPGHGNHWISLRLEGKTSNRSAIGARIKVTVSGPSGSREIHRTVGSGGSFGANPLRQEIGLGDATTIDQVDIFWPATGRTQVLKQLDPDAFYHILEGEDRAQKVDQKPTPFKLGASDPHEHHHHHHHHQ